MIQDSTSEDFARSAQADTRFSQPAVLENIRALLAGGALEDAMESARLLAHSGQPEALHLIGAYLLTRPGLTTQHVQFLAGFIPQFPSYAPLLWVVAAGWYGLHQRNRAEPLLRQVAALKPLWHQPRFLLGKHLYNAGRFAQAIPFLTDAASLKPDDFDSRFLLGICFAAEERYEEAISSMERASALRPADQGARDYLTEFKSIATSPPPRNTFARWPAASSDMADPCAAIESYVLRDFPSGGLKVNPGMSIFTQGSCFAGNLATSLARYPLRVNHMPCGEEHNNTFANRVVLDWLLHGVHDERSEIVSQNLGSDMRAAYREALKSADFFVYTMGLAVAHFDRDTGAFVMPRASQSNKAMLFRHCVFRTTTVQENVENLLHIFAGVRELAPRSAILLTVSPVPLMVTTEFHSAIVADCLSKSTLRVAAHEILGRNIPRLVYWPSFEAVRWIGGHTSSVYGADDGSTHHVNRAIVDTIVDGFIRTFGNDVLLATQTAG